MDYRIISIGTLSHNEFWPGEQPARTPHATTVLVRSGDMTLLVDPALPEQVLAARLQERAGLRPEAVTHVFLTSFRPAHRGGLEAFPDATWWVAEAEREAVGQALVTQFRQADQDDLSQILQREIALLKRCVTAPDKLAEHVDLFPLPGYTPGNCGLVLSHPRLTTVIAGDAVPTVEHLEHGQVLRGGYDLDKARESLLEVIEIADVIVPGHDNVIVNRMKG